MRNEEEIKNRIFRLLNERLEAKGKARGLVNQSAYLAEYRRQINIIERRRQQLNELYWLMEMPLIARDR